jgi:hypothetical protein
MKYDHLMYVRSLPAAAKASQPPNPIVTRRCVSPATQRWGTYPVFRTYIVQYGAVLRGREGSRRSWTAKYSISAGA